MISDRPSQDFVSSTKEGFDQFRFSIRVCSIRPTFSMTICRSPMQSDEQDALTSGANNDLTMNLKKVFEMCGI
jgi:hypothetical protein